MPGWPSTGACSVTSCSGETTTSAKPGWRWWAQGTELVLTTTAPYAPTWLVSSVDRALDTIVKAGGRAVSGVTDVPVGRLAVAEDVFGNQLVLLDTSKGRYVTHESGPVPGVE